MYDKIKEKYKDIEIYIWFGSGFGGCDIPIYLDKYGFDLIIHFGHSKFYKLKMEEQITVLLILSIIFLFISIILLLIFSLSNSLIQNLLD
ncbi:hypothetical protein [Candidatus Nanopusillus massiliensis]